MYILQRKAKAIERGKEREKENPKRRETKVASEQKLRKIYLNIEDYRIHICVIYMSILSCMQRSPALL